MNDKMLALIIIGWVVIAGLFTATAYMRGYIDGQNDLADYLIENGDSICYKSQKMAEECMDVLINTTADLVLCQFRYNRECT